MTFYFGILIVFVVKASYDSHTLTYWTSNLFQSVGGAILQLVLIRRSSQSQL